jgi:altronate dehydratase small subunit
MSNQKQAIIIDQKDNVATAIRDLKAGDSIEIERGVVVLVCDIPFGHKFALSDIPKGEYVVKYGAQIGRATLLIGEGDHVHVHNVEDITDEVRKGV